MGPHRWTVVAPLLGAALLKTSMFASAARERLVVSEGGVRFIFFIFDDGRSKPYRLRFKDNGETSTFLFDADGDATTITSGGDRYKVSDSGVSTRRLTSESKSNNKRSLGGRSTTGRVLAEEDILEAENLLEGFDEGFPLEHEHEHEHEHRRLFECSDCEDAWDVMCGQGLSSVCDLVGFGSPFGSVAEAAIATMCDNFGDACSNLSAGQGCDGQCEGDSGTDDACSANPCNGGTCTVDPGGGYMCSSCPSNFGGMHCQIDTSDLDPFYIEIEYIGTWTNAEESLVRAQADRWEEVITHVPCGGSRDDPAGRLKISASQTNIDGVGNTLGSAGPDYIWIDCPGVSIEGSMEFDIADLGLMSESELEFLYLHEMGHVIGIGTNWEECSTCDQTRDSEWMCPAAQKIYGDFLGISPPSTANIVETRHGLGTRCGHWSEAIFVDEVMTGFSEVGAFEPLSKLTVASLEDIGYIVDPGTADPYTLPSQRDSSIKLEEPVVTERPDVDVTKTKYYVNSDGEIVGQKEVQASVRF